MKYFAQIYLASAIAVFTILHLNIANAQASADQKTPKIHLVWMGGNDCPPCVAWRREELPKLEESSEFKSVQFSYVTKVIKSPVPPRIFLPSEVKPLMEKLDFASNGMAGSPQAALFVNGEIYDYFTGTRSAETILKMITAIKDDKPYPFSRCIKISRSWGKCETAIKPGFTSNL